MCFPGFDLCISPGFDLCFALGLTCVCPGVDPPVSHNLTHVFPGYDSIGSKINAIATKVCTIYISPRTGIFLVEPRKDL